MTPDEHYAEAERLIQEYRNDTTFDRGGWRTISPRQLTEAQVHATLANATRGWRERRIAYLEGRLERITSERDDLHEQRGILVDRAVRLRGERDRARGTVAALEAELAEGRRRRNLAVLCEQVPETEEPRLCGCGRYGDHDEHHEEVQP